MAKTRNLEGGKFLGLSFRKAGCPWGFPQGRQEAPPCPHTSDTLRAPSKSSSRGLSGLRGSLPSGKMKCRRSRTMPFLYYRGKTFTNLSLDLGHSERSFSAMALPV